LEGGREGQTYRDLKDFFYYSQIRSNKEDTTKARKLLGKVPLNELPDLMRALVRKIKREFFLIYERDIIQQIKRF